MLELAKKVLDISGSSSRIVHQPLPPDDPVRRRPDISRAMALLDWRPTIALDDGLGRTVADFRQQIAGGG